MPPPASAPGCDAIQNMIMYNAVPTKLLERYKACIEDGECPVPIEYRSQVIRHIDHAIRSDDVVTRFFVLLTALSNSKSVREMIAASSDRHQSDWWIDGAIAKAWGDFFLGSGLDGSSSCTRDTDAMHQDVTGFVARLQADYMSFGWATPRT
jgi:hypothetical protein